MIFSPGGVGSKSQNSSYPQTNVCQVAAEPVLLCCFISVSKKAPKALEKSILYKGSVALCLITTLRAPWWSENTHSDFSCTYSSSIWKKYPVESLFPGIMWTFVLCFSFHLRLIGAANPRETKSETKPRLF